MNAFAMGYLECIYFAECGDEGQPSQSARMPRATLKELEEACAEFERDNAELLRQAYERDGYSETSAGHDFWLTRNGHGAGFWDRDELSAGELGDKLTLAAKACGEVYLYGSRGWIYFG